jgi:PhzF family phenazine biosynthesis protein
MAGRSVRFMQVDVFTSVPFLGNPLAVVFDADELDTAQMQAIARWTQLSETVFFCTPDDPAADYRIRIFTQESELPFAGHPTLGAAHAWRASGGPVREPGRLIQQCGAGLIELREQDGQWAFAAPAAHLTALRESDYAALAAALRSNAIDFSAVPYATNNGAPWFMVRLASVADCLALQPDPALLIPLMKNYGMLGIAVYAPHAAGGPADFELRCLIPGLGAGPGEDPVTGSANAALAELLKRQELRPGLRYTVRQGTALGRNGRITVHYDDDASRIWIAGDSVTVVDGQFRLP